MRKELKDIFDTKKTGKKEHKSEKRGIRVVLGKRRKRRY